jgi:hypothetical protein
MSVSNSPLQLQPFLEDNKSERTEIGKILLGYSELEIALLGCVAAVRNDFDFVFKTIYTTWNAEDRIRKGKKLGEAYFKPYKLDKQFVAGVKAMDHCRDIRNHYAHCQWYGDGSGAGIIFVNLEEEAETTNLLCGIHHLAPKGKQKVIDLPLLEAQYAFFKYVVEIFLFVEHETRAKLDSSYTHSHKYPAQPTRPPLHR